MSLLGIRLTILAGPTVPLPVPPSVLESLESVEVRHTDEGRSGFEIVFQVGRGPTDLLDYALVSNPQLRPFCRVILIVTFGVLPQVLMDGIILTQNLTPGDGPGRSKWTIKGEDVSVMMDRQEKNAEHPAQPDPVIALKIIASYAQYGLVPLVIPPPTLDVPLPIERTPTQQNTDLRYLQELAARYAYVFYITAGPAPGVNTAYWGPPVRVGLPQSALTYNMGPNSNVQTIEFQHNADDPAQVSGQVQDRMSNQTVPVRTVTTLRPPLSSQPPNPLNARERTVRASGATVAQAFAQAQAISDASTNEVVTGSGELNTASYGGVLQARALVGVRGVGFSYDGFYYVKNVTHKISKRGYTQQFSLAREGLGALLPVVRP